MIRNPVVIIGAPRSGTSLLQKVLRGFPGFWSMPSESDMIWDQYCHPRLRNWESERMSGADLTEAMRLELHRQFERYTYPSAVWKPFEDAGVIWSFERSKVVRWAMRHAYRQFCRLKDSLPFTGKERRIIEKTASNCFRLGFVNAVFPDARFIYVTRDGRNNVNSLINAWQHPTRFFTYDVPVELRIRGYEHARWKFVLPPGWRDYVEASLEEVCAFQWRACHESVLSEIAKPEYQGRVLRIKLEELVARPIEVLSEVCDFMQVSDRSHAESVGAHLPVINSLDNDPSANKWRGHNADRIARIVPQIAPVMDRLGYRM
jgi:Sulfotransferase family